MTTESRYKNRAALEEIHFHNPPYFAIRRYDNPLSRLTVADSSLLSTPGVLENNIKLENAVPLAGFVGKEEARSQDYVRTVKFKILHQNLERIKEILKEAAVSLSSVSEILSFVGMESLEEPDILILWERYVSREAFAQSQREDGPYRLAWIQKIAGSIEAEEVIEYSVAGGYLSNAH